MNNLTTRKIVLGILMTLVLAFSVQGIADAATITVFDADPVDLSSLNIGERIEFDIEAAAAIAGSNESVTFSVSNGANFPLGDDLHTSYTWRENQGGLSAIPSKVDVTVNRPGEVTATLSASGATTRRMTFYVVKRSFDVNFNDTVSLINATNGIGARYDDTGPVKIHNGDGRNNPVTYSITGGGNLFIQEGSDTARTLAVTSGARISSNADVWLNMGVDATDANDGNSNTVTVGITNGSRKTQAVYIFGNPSLAVSTTPDPFEGPPGSASQNDVANSITVAVNDQNIDGTVGGAVPNVPVKFDVADKSATGGYLIPNSVDSDGDMFSDNIVDANNNPIRQDQVPAATRTVYMRSDGTNGKAKVGFELGTVPGTSDVTVSVSGRNVSLSEDVKVKVTGGITTTLTINENSRRSENSNLYDLIAEVRRDGEPLRGVKVTFQTRFGRLENTPTGEIDIPDPDGGMDPISDKDKQEDLLQVTEVTGRLGLAEVIYDIGSNTGRQEIDASIYDADANLRQEVTFVINGTGSTGGNNTNNVPLPTSLSFSPATLSGAPGETRTLTVTGPANTAVTIGNIAFSIAGGSASPNSVNTGASGSATSTITLPSTANSYTLSLGVGGTVVRSVPVTVTSAASSGTTSGTFTVQVQPGSGAPGTTSVITVTALDADNDAAEGVNITLNITAGGGTFASAFLTTDATGVARTTLTRGSTVGNNYFITATASGYTQTAGNVNGERVIISGTAGTSASPAAGEADSIDVYDGNGQTGVLNSGLGDPLVVEVVDGNDNPVENVRVAFITTIGSGRFAPTRPRTDRNGRAQTNFIPTSSGRIRISASVDGVTRRAVFIVYGGEAPESFTKVSGDNQTGTPGDALDNPFVVEVKDADGDAIEGLRVSFSVTAGGGSLSQTSATTDEDGLAQTTLTLGSQAGVNSVQASAPGVDAVTFSTSIEPKILVAAANRPVMYWIDGGALYRLAGEKATKIADGANDAAIGGGKIYWTAATGENSGSINSANLDGTDATTLKAIQSVPIGIAVDTAGSKLYWTNTRGRIQSANLNGSSIQNVLENLSDPTDIIVSNGFIYWTEGGNTIRRINTTGQKVARDVAADLDTVGGIAVDGGKVYWTEQTGAGSGSINVSNLNGTNFETLKTLLSAPMGIAVDTAGSKLYWTNARGRVQSGSLSVGKVTNVVEGLISAGQLVIGGANVAPPVATKPTTTAPTTKDTSDYDVNGDGAVDNTDAALVAGAMDTDNDDYDVNGDGTVNFLDLLLVFDHRDAAAAAAPTIVGMKLSALQVDNIQQQIDLLIATNDRSPAAMRTLVYLQQLLATARPDQTQLLANYPNPFNPETWIPYQLATDTNVQIKIYNTQGVVIRALQLGHQSAGYYTDRNHAAYWDGRNSLGELVASGIYFYQLETDEMSTLRKMVILK